MDTPTRSQSPSRMVQPKPQIVGTERIEKKQPWREMIHQEEFLQPEFMYFTNTPFNSESKEIRLLQELDSKGR